MEIFFLIALTALAAYCRHLNGRIARLEQDVRELEGVSSLGRPVPELRLRPPVARVVRHSAPMPPQHVEEPDEAAALPLTPDAPEPVHPAAPPPVEALARDHEEFAPAEPPETLGGLFERLVGGSLLIWIGGIALALSGLFLVRYSIQIGLITPPVRMLMAAAFGLLLIAAGEIARRRPGAVADPRAAQALVGAGVLVLYAAAYGAHILYDLIGMRTASAAMMAVTLAALALALRHGAPAAVMGLVGGFLTPVLVGQGSATSLPLLTYLALLNGALFALAARRGWTWLAASAVLLSFAWTLVLAFLSPAHALPAGVFILVLSLAGSLLRAGGGWHLDFIRPAAIGLLQLAILVGREDLGLPAWALFAALSAATFYLAERKIEYRPLPVLALVAALALLFLKAAAPGANPLVPPVAGGIALLFAAGAMLRAGRGGVLPAAVACLAFAGPLVILRLVEPGLLEPLGWGLLAVAAAAGPLFLAWRRGSAKNRDEADRALVLAAATALLLLGIAAVDLAPATLVGPLWLALAVGAAFAARRLADRGVAGVALLAASAASLWSVSMVPALWATAAASLTGEPALAAALPSPGRTLLVLGLPVPLLVLLWRFAAPPRRAQAAPLALAALFAGACAYVLFKQVFALASGADFVARGLAERTLVNQALFLLGWLVCSGRVPIRGIAEEPRRLMGLLLTAMAAARLVWFDMLLHNPLAIDQHVGRLPVLNLLVPAYILSAFWLYKARRSADSETRSSLWLLLFLAAAALGTLLMVRQLFHGALLTGADVSQAESYGYSLAGLLLSAALLIGGIRLPDKALRLAGLALLTATICKVFLSDAAALEGVLRILSFLGLGVALIGIGKLYGAVLRAEAPGARAPQP